MWSTNVKPKKTGWYLVTVNNSVMPAKRCEYPKGNFYWSEICRDLEPNIIAVQKFPTPYKKSK